MKVFQTDHEGFLVGDTVADPDPMDEGNWLIPGGCVEQEPPTLSDGQRAKFVSGAWLVVDPEPVVETEPEPELPPTKEQQEQLRKWTYQQEADPCSSCPSAAKLLSKNGRPRLLRSKPAIPIPRRPKHERCY